MLEAMNIKLLKTLLALMLLISTSVSATMYKGVDSEGNVVFSDTPFENAEKFTPPPITVMDKPKATVKNAAAEEKPLAFKYMSFDIVSPVNNATIRNSEVQVSLQLKPGLNTAKDHSIWMLVNGKPVIKKSSGLSFSLGRLNRGAHKLQAQVRDPSGKVILRSRTAIIHVHQTSAGN